MTRFIYWLRWIGLGVAALLLLLLMPALFIGLSCYPFGTLTAQPASVIAPNITANYARSEDQTYLTYPEWYIVYNADEYAAFLVDHRPSEFPYFQAVGQVWGIYGGVCKVTRAQYPFNSGYHLSNYVTSSSFSLETLLRGLYEGSVGRVTELFSTIPTEEEIYARDVAKEYGTFIHTIPWYEFPFRQKLDGLWAQTNLWGTNPIRKWERKLALSVEYGVKSIYAGLIKQGTQGVYAPEDLSIFAIVEGLNDEMLKREPDVRFVKAIDATRTLVSITRYEQFTLVVPRLTKAGLRFVEIAGNDEILLTAFASQAWRYDLSVGRGLFAVDVLTQPQRKRVAIQVPVASLHIALAELAQRGVTLEHIYDY